ncbi:MAG: hypothetical protein A3C11_01240 [Candidatus Sungbacteria bacterium RIFCSPHIGHO2_02_FULL_49_12]|uniref:Uncharacterized protein n=1 Tax=Candidatus Sungbacteria bacterium RIFCSPHIGHO2_02_FULL_49_12 TaxID=1802271 RepID=A0A1G2KM37_9BACT|nr:MAG: hypothetical protein A3C11_01240 [Candidatus Sungbacteria bacterium RIFCSPHIGHO2_02_FULL_49_12]
MPTLTLADFIADPAVPVQVNVYVVVTVGLTDSVPDSALVPTQPSEAVQVVALADDQVRVDDWPGVIVEGEADRDRVGVPGGGRGGGVGGGTGVGSASVPEINLITLAV